MKLKHRLAIYSIIIFSVIIGLLSFVIYFSFYNIAEKKELQSLEIKSELAAIFYLDQDELSTSEHEDIRSQLARKISRKNIAVFELPNKRVNGLIDTDPNITTSFIKLTQKHRTYSFVTEDYFYNGIFYKDNQGDFVVITRESTAEFNDQMKSLLKILVIACIICLVFIYFFSHFLGHIAYAPINKIIQQIEERNSSNFQNPISIDRSYAEVNELINTYNKLIEQIAHTFNVQKNFIDYVSHELRSPITALMGTIEVADSRDRSVSEYKEVLANLNQYVVDLEETLNQMMILSGAKTTFELTSFRIDEVLWEVIEEAITLHQASIEVQLNVEKTDLLEIKGNNKLMHLALANLIGNAIKYSNNQKVIVDIDVVDEQLELKIKDMGIGIPSSELDHIKNNFYRATNTSQFEGKGIGLSMANIIMKLHKINLSISNNEQKGAMVTLLFNAF